MKFKKFIVGGIIFAAGIIAFAQNGRPDALKLYREGNYKDSIAACESELKINPKNMDSYAVMCWALVANKQYSEAEQRATEARKINSYDIRLIEVLGEAKYYLEKNQEALDMFQRYVANGSENAARIGAAYYYMGEIYVRLSKFEHADISLSRAVRAEPLRDLWWARLGWAREKAGDYTNALAAYEKSLSLNPSQYDAGRGRTRCLSHM